MSARRRTQPFAGAKVRQPMDIDKVFAGSFSSAEDANAARAMLTPVRPAPGGNSDQWLASLDPKAVRLPETYLRRHIDVAELQALQDAIVAAGRILQPVQVVPDPATPGAYLLRDGQRRWMAATALGIPLPALIDASASADEAVAELYRQVILNSNRADEPILDRARFFVRIVRDAERLGVAVVVGSIVTPRAAARGQIAEDAPVIKQVAGKLGISTAQAYLLAAMGEAVIALEDEGEAELVTRLTEHPGVTIAVIREAFAGNLSVGARKAALRQLDQRLTEGAPAAEGTKRRPGRPVGRKSAKRGPLTIRTQPNGTVKVVGGWKASEVAKDPDRFRHRMITALDDLRLRVDEAVRAARKAESSGVDTAAEPTPIADRLPPPPGLLALRAARGEGAGGTGG